MPTYGPWMDDAIPTDYFVDQRDTRTPGSGATSFTWGSTSRSTDATLSTAEKVAQAWNGTGPDAPVSGPAYQASGIQIPESYLGPRAIYDTTWLTMQHPTITLAAGTLTPERSAEIDSTPGVISLEWQPTSTRIAEWILVTADDAQLASVGRSAPVKFVDAVPLPRWEPAFEAAGVMNSRPTIASIGLSADGGVASGQVTIPLTVTSSAAFAVSVVDPYTAAMSFAGLSPGQSSGVFFSVALAYRFEPQLYRLVYSDVVTPAAPVSQSRVTPSLRMLQRGGSGGIGGIPRMVGNPTVRGSLRRGPGSVL